MLWQVARGVERQAIWPSSGMSTSVHPTIESSSATPVERTAFANLGYPNHGRAVRPETYDFRTGAALANTALAAQARTSGTPPSSWVLVPAGTRIHHRDARRARQRRSSSPAVSSLCPRTPRVLPVNSRPRDIASTAESTAGHSSDTFLPPIMDLGIQLNGTELLDQIKLRGSGRVFDALSQTQGATRSAAAALTLLTWDILTTMDDEAKLIWPSDWTLPKALYLFVRYYSLVSLTVQNIRIAVPCVPWLIFQIMSTFLVEAAVEVIVILRVYAVYATRPKILRIMMVGFGLEVAVMAASLGFSIKKVKTGLNCLAADLPTEMVFYSTASTVYEAFLFGLMMYGVLQGTKEGFHSDTLLLSTLVRDGAAAFIAVFLVMIMNTILFTLAPSTLVTLGFPWLLAILGAAGPRLILNLRAKHANTIGGPSSLGDLRFSIPSHFYSAVNLDDPDLTPSPPLTPDAHAADASAGSDREVQVRDTQRTSRHAIDADPEAAAPMLALSPSSTSSLQTPSPR